jgi:beta-N-acetylhexosaminidase
VPGGPAASAAELGRRGPAAAGAAGLATGRLLRDVGVNVDLAPVADVARRGSGIGADGRAFGSRPGRVAAAARAFAAGLARAGVAATAKHFPGFGAPAASTDDRPVRIGLPLGTLRAVDERPFAALVDAGVPLVMMSSAVYPALDARPAALSARWVRGELRGRLGFAGVVATDALDTPALAGAGGAPGAAVAAAAAGVDLLLVAGRYSEAVRTAAAVAAALRSGRLGAGPARESVARVLALRTRLR